jgi:hypothetical protein
MKREYYSLGRVAHLGAKRKGGFLFCTVRSAALVTNIETVGKGFPTAQL